MPVSTFPTTLDTAPPNYAEFFWTYVAALEAKVGVDGSAVTTSLDYALRRSSQLLAANTSIPGGNTVANTTTETAFASLCPVPANTLVAGSILWLRLAGTFGTTLIAPTLRARVKYGTVVLLDTGALTLVANISNNAWWADALLTVNAVGASGQLECSGTLLFSTGATAALTVVLDGGAATVDTTAAADLKATVQWGTADAANTATLRQLTVVVIGPPR